MTPPEDDRPPGSPDQTTPLPGESQGESELPQVDRTTPLPKPSGLGTPVGDDQATRRTPVTAPTTPSPQTPARGVEGPTFSPDELLADRYKVIRFIGEGGMGEVYEVEDLELGERVALKTIRPEAAGDARAIERFKREIQLARKVTHPNVCRIFDLGYHRTASGEAITFLTMELLQGETLAERLREVRRMTTQEALPIVAQMAAGLSAAHRAGVIHRDFKSGNVVLVTSKEGFRAVVTDFGLARRTAAGATVAASISGPGGVVGTPAYMAPEQVEGGEITPAADIYALGVVMYEMLTGTWPFVGDTPLATAVKRLKEPPTSPRSHVPDLDPKWEAVILRCLEPHPGDRFVGAEDVPRALVGEVVAPARKLQRRRFVLAALALFILLASVLGYQLRVARKLRRPSPPQVAGVPAITPRRSVAVLGFKNISGRADAAWLSTALAEMLTTELAAGEKLRTTSGENVARMKIDLALPDADSFAKDTLARIQRNLGSDVVVLGSYIVLGKESGGQIRLDLRLQDAAAGETIAAVSESGTEAKLFDLASRAGAKLREKLGVGEISAAEASMVKASLPSNPEAARLYAEGLTKLRLFDALAARDLLERAVAAEPRYALAHSALAAAWSTLGYDTKAKDRAREAFELSANLSREDRLSIEGRYREMNKEWDKAVEIYRTLWGFFPDNLDYGLWLALAQTSAGKGKDALATIEALRKLPPPAADDLRIDLAEARAAESLSDFKRDQAAAAKGAAKGAAQGARLLVARARRIEGLAFYNLGELPRALALYDDARRIYAAAGDRGGVAWALNNSANVTSDQGDLAGAKKTYEEALTIFSEIGDKRGVAAALNNLAAALWQEGDLAAAKRRFEESLAVSRETNNKIDVAAVLSNIAVVLWQQGDLPGAKQRNEESLAASREIGDKTGVAAALTNIAQVLHRQGDLSGAKSVYEEALGVCREIGNKSYWATNLFGLGEVLLAEGNLPNARQRHEEALAMRNELGEKGAAAQSRVALADLAVEQDRPAEAGDPAREAAEEFQKEKAASDEALALAALAKSLQAQGKHANAESAIDRATGLLGKSENRDIRLSVAITAARIRAASGKLSDRTEAAKSLEATLREAKKAGFVGYQLAARLALGEIELQSGNAVAGRAHLEALEKEARAKGFGFIARKAGAALEKKT